MLRFKLVFGGGFITITVETVLNIDKDNAREAAKSLERGDLPGLVGWLSEKDDKLRYPSLLLLQSRSAICDDVYPFWEVFREKLKSDNSYQRSIGMMLIAENARWDNENRLDGMFDEYFRLFRDDKPITIRQSIQALGSIIPYKPALTGRIASALMSIKLPEIKETMRKSILLDILEALVLIRRQNPDDSIDSYIFDALSGAILDKKSKSAIEAMLR